MIGRKTFMKLMDLEGEHSRERTQASLATVEALMSECSRPWKASQKQLQYWNEWKALER